MTDPSNVRMQSMVLASSNAHKLEEISAITAQYGITLLTLQDVGLADLEIVEDGTTFEENALIKARAVMARTGLPSLADDSGLAVDALAGAPGVYSARYGGEPRSDQRNNEKLLAALKDVPEGGRGAQFVCVIAVAWPDEAPWLFRGEASGTIGFEPVGVHGFGYDPLFWLPDGTRTFAQLTGDEKNQISHRARALEKLAARLNAQSK